MYNARLIWLQLKYAPIAQLDRVLGYEPRGQEFESLWAHHKKQRVRSLLLLALFVCVGTFKFLAPRAIITKLRFTIALIRNFVKSLMQSCVKLH